MKKLIPTVLIVFFFSNVITYGMDTLTTECGKIGDYTYRDGQCKVLFANREAGKKVAITFDDGPSTEYTEKILDILERYNVKATFFVIGENAVKYPEILRMIEKSGHEIGNHSYSHPSLRGLSSEKINKEISETQKLIFEITGSTPKIFRPPGGYISNDIVEIATLNNCKTVLWSWRQDTMDWKCPAVETVVSTVISNIRGGDIILFHDYISGNSPTPCALETIIPKLLDMGYELVTVSELMEK